jgi:hypothetical protein
VLVPALISSFENIKKLTMLFMQIWLNRGFKNWDYYAKENSVATTLANEWA